MNLIFIGPPGAGKGTQAQIFRRRHGIPHISTGDIFRAAVRAGTEVGRKAQAYVHRGDLVPDDIVQEIIEARLAEPDAEAGFILDGYPRTLPQAEALDGLLARTGRRLDAVVFFEIREEVLLRRLTDRWVCPVCGTIYHLDHKPPRVPGRCDVEGAVLIQRKDDAPETVLHRLEVYRRRTAPLVDYYRARRLFLAVNAEGAVLDVYKRILAFVESRASQEAQEMGPR
jgi:adenylate kinase